MAVAESPVIECELLLGLLTVSTDSVPAPALGPIPSVSFCHIQVLKEGRGSNLKQSCRGSLDRKRLKN